MGLLSVAARDPFLLRAQRSEQYRAMFMAGLLAVMLVLTIFRQSARVAVWGAPYLEVGSALVLAVWLAYQCALFARLRYLTRLNRLVPDWSWRVNVGLDLLFPAILMLGAREPSVRGELGALSAPPVLLFPIVILLSILRLRPNLTLATGLGAAVLHWILLGRATHYNPITLEQYPTYLAYGIALAMTGVAGWLVARRVKGYVLEAADEAAARERDHARLAGIERELDVARDIQAGLLPTGNPAFPGFDIAGMNRPADETGGDYYDWHLLPDGRLAVAVADVTGHGIGSALLMAVCRAYARASVPMVSDCGEFFRRLNEFLYPDLRGDRFITFALALIDRRGSIDLCSAGHGPTLLYRADTGRVERFGADGIPLGVEATVAYAPARSLELQPGDVLLMLTDGFFEWKRPDGQAFGIDRLCDELIRSSRNSAADILDSLDKRVSEFVAGSKQSDDMTAVVVRRL